MHAKVNSYIPACPFDGTVVPSTLTTGGSQIPMLWYHVQAVSTAQHSAALPLWPSDGTHYLDPGHYITQDGPPIPTVIIDILSQLPPAKQLTFGTEGPLIP